MTVSVFLTIVGFLYGLKRTLPGAMECHKEDRYEFPIGQQITVVIFCSCLTAAFGLLSSVFIKCG